MDAAIGRLTVARPAPPRTVEPVQDERDLERAIRRDRAERAAEADRTFWTAAFHSRGRF